MISFVYGSCFTNESLFLVRLHWRRLDISQNEDFFTADSGKATCDTATAIPHRHDINLSKTWLYEWTFHDNKQSANRYTNSFEHIYEYTYVYRGFFWEEALYFDASRALPRLD